MIISHKYKFIFVKTAKTAGTSLEVFLSKHCGGADILTPIYPPIKSHVARNYKGLWNPLPEILHFRGRYLKAILGNFLRRQKFHNHIPAILIRHRIAPEIWNEYFKFCVERNPWDMTLSNYYMLKYRSGGRLSFDQYMRSENFRSNFHLYTDLAGNLMLDKVIKYETLINDLRTVFRELDIPFTGTLGIEAKSEYRTTKAPYQELYSDEQMRMVEKAFEREIKMHSYSFKQDSANHV